MLQKDPISHVVWTISLIVWLAFLVVTQFLYPKSTNTYNFLSLTGYFTTIFFNSSNLNLILFFIDKSFWWPWKHNNENFGITHIKILMWFKLSWITNLFSYVHMDFILWLYSAHYLLQFNKKKSFSLISSYSFVMFNHNFIMI